MAGPERLPIGITPRDPSQEKDEASRAQPRARAQVTDQGPGGPLVLDMCTHSRP